MAVISVDVFSLAPDADETAFLARNEEVQAWCHANCAGLLRRPVARNERAWLVLAAWVNRTDFEAALPEDRPALDEFVDATTFRHNSSETL